MDAQTADTHIKQPGSGKRPGSGKQPGSVAGMAVAGLVTATPFAIVLSQLGLLFMFLGLFFFILFGLIIGAVMFRVGRSARPIGREKLMLVGAGVSLFTWGVALYVEAYSMPWKIAVKTLAKTHKLPDDLTREAALDRIERDARQQFRQQYGSAGVVGYSRWILGGRAIETRATPAAKLVSSPTPQSRIGYAIRVFASLALVLLGIFSEILPLQRVADSAKSTASERPDRDEPA